MPHLPYAYDDDDEFRHPIDGWLLLDRTIVFDSWILWRHALPLDRRGRGLLHAEAAALITALAERLHAIHLRMPGYSNLDDTPFVFTRWWSPHSEDKAFNSGSGCVFRIKGQPCSAIIEAFVAARPGHLALTPLPGGAMKAELTHTDPACLGRNGLPSGRPQRKGQRRTPQSPPVQTPG